MAPCVKMIVLMALKVTHTHTHCCYAALSARCSVVWSSAQVLPLQTMRTCTSAADH